MTTYNASEIDRLVREGTEDNERMTPGPWSAERDGSNHRGKVYENSDRAYEHIATTYCGAYDGHGQQNAEAIARTRNNLPATVAALSAAKAECERLSEALTKISAIRDSIVGCQGFNFSEHAYPLVAALDAAGFKGAGYEIASKNLGTLIEQRDAAERDRDRLAAEVERLTKERDEARAEWQGADGKADWYVKECERLRVLVGEACDIGSFMADLYAEVQPHDLVRVHSADRLAAIRHAAGVDNA